MSFLRKNRPCRDSGFSEAGSSFKTKEKPTPNPKAISKVGNLTKKYEEYGLIQIRSSENRKTYQNVPTVDVVDITQDVEKISFDRSFSGTETLKLEENASSLYANLSAFRLDKAQENSDGLSDKNKKILSYKIKELITTEEAHIEKLLNGIKTYIKHVKRYDRGFFPNISVDLPLYVNALGSLEEMHEFHTLKLLPQLIASQNDPYNIAQLFHTCFTEDSFYIYIRYACGRSLIESLVQEHHELFTELAKDGNDRMGVSHFLNVPFERLRQYKLLFEDIYKVLQNDEKCSADVLRAYFRAKERLGDHLQTFNDALHLRQIENYCEMIDWSHMGQFKKMGQFTVKTQNNKYPSKAFLFDRSILMTKVLDEETLEIMDFLPVRDIQYINADNDDEFIIVTAENRDINFFGESKVVHDWIQILASESDRESFWFGTEGFDQTKLLTSLKKIENHFKHFLLKTDFMQRLPKILSHDISFQEAYTKVIEFHCNVIDPALESKVTNLSELCQHVHQWLTEPSFMIYKEYAYMAAMIMIHLQSCKIGEEETVLFELEPLIEAPLKHLVRYQNFFSRVMNRLSKTLNVVENMNLVKVVAKASNEFNSFANLVRENYEFKKKFYGLDFGVIRYSDLVTETGDSQPYQLMLLEKAIVAVELLDANLENEPFKCIKWSIPYNDVLFEYCLWNSERIFIFVKSRSKERFPVIFRSSERRKEFLKHFVICF